MPSSSLPLLARLSTLLVLASSLLPILLVPVLATVTSQFHLSPSGSDQSPCWLRCHVTLTSQGILEAPPTAPHGVGSNDPTLLSDNCRWETYRTALSTCLLQECSLARGSYDLAYAAEYASIVCRKAGVQGFVVDVPASVTKSVEGYYATATPEDLVELSYAKRSSAAATTRLARPEGVLLVAGVTAWAAAATGWI